MIEIAKQVFVQASVTHATVKGLAKSVLGRFSRLDIMPLNFSFLGPGENGVRGHLSPVVADNHARFAAPFDDGVKGANDPPPGKGRIGNNRQALLGYIVDDV